jgi:sulfate transport system ATP-binding protein
VEIEGTDATDLPAQKRNVGFVFQHYAAFRHMNVAANVGYGLKIRKRPKREIAAKVDELLALVHLSQFADRLPSQLSGGQRQRMALARALAIEPKVLLLDEPFGALDAKVRKELRAWLRRLHDEVHVTTVFVTHDQEEALEVADQIVVINDGSIEQIGSPDELYDTPASEFVMSFSARSRCWTAASSDRTTSKWSPCHSLTPTPDGSSSQAVWASKSAWRWLWSMRLTQRLS